MSDAGYPSEPWELRGQLHGSLFTAPLASIPLDVPPGWRRLSLRGNAIVAAVWVSYEPGGVLSYRELMTTVLVRRGWQVLPTITHIWVDSVASRDGGRALWGIPKQLAQFSFDAGLLTARDDEGAIAAGTVRRRIRLPGQLPMRFSVVQWLAGRAKVSRVRSSAALVLDRATFAADPGGPLAFLAGRRPIVSFTLADFRMTFGG